MPRVSVIMASYNHADFVSESVESVLGQSFEDFEFIITDDGSSDGTLEVIRKFADPRIRLEAFPENRGAVDATNHAIGRARGEMIAILNSDDYFLPGKLALQVAFLDANRDAAAVFGLPLFVDESGKPVQDKGAPYLNLFGPANKAVWCDKSRHAWLRSFFRSGNGLCHPTVMIRREVYDQVGLYDRRYTQLPDFDMWIRVCSQFNIRVLEEPLTAFRLLSQERNVSGARPASMARHAWETEHVLHNFRRLSDDDFHQVFSGDLAALGETEACPRDVALARLASRQESLPHRIFGLNLLFSAAAKYPAQVSPSEIARIAAEIDPMKMSAHALTLQHARNLETIRDAQAAEIAQLRATAAFSWWISKPLRVLKRAVKRCASRPLLLLPSVSGEEWSVDNPAALQLRAWAVVSIRAPDANSGVFPILLSATCADRQGAHHNVTIDRPGSRMVRFPGPVTALTLKAVNGAVLDGVRIRITPIGKARVVAHLLRTRFLAASYAAALATITGRRAPLNALLAEYLNTVDYATWTRLYDTPSQSDLERMRTAVCSIREPPIFSVITPTYNSPPQYLTAMIDSIRAQAYPHWELCIADDASPNAEVRQILDTAARDDQRIKVEFRLQNGNISAASNTALGLAAGSHFALVDHDDLLPPHALATVAQRIGAHPRSDIFYSDEDKVDAEGRRFDPYFKPDWNEELVYSQNYANHLSVYRAGLVRDLGGFRLGYEGSQDYDLLLRAFAASKAPVIHIPHILYHRRIFQGAGTFSLKNFEIAASAARRAITEKFAAEGVPVKVSEGIDGHHRLTRPAPETWPRVSVIIPTRDYLNVLRPCVQGLLEQTDYPDLEILIADNDSVKEETHAYFSKLSALPNVRIIPTPGPFNYSRINNIAARAATGSVLLLLNNDISMISSGWLKEMVRHAVRKEVGAVGARLLYPDGTLQHGGVVLGLGGVAGHFQCGAAGDDPGYFASLLTSRETSCVTAACMATPRRVFEELGGLDEDNLTVAYNDVDYCIRVRQKGYKIIWTPYAELTHWESKSRGSDLRPEALPRFQREICYMQGRWGAILASDPYFNPNLDLSSVTPQPAHPPRIPRPWA